MTHASLFTGIGAFDYAAQKLGMTNIYGCDNDAFAQAHFKQHYPGAILYDDVCTIKNAPYVDILTAGFPCQDISIAGLREKKDLKEHNRTGLFYETIRIIRESKPAFVVYENVPQLRKNGLVEVIREITECGYSCGWAIISAKMFGALHERKRCIIISYASSVGWQTIIKILNRIISEAEKEKRKSVLTKFSRNVLHQISQETNSEFDGENDGFPNKLHQALRARSIGNSIYYPMAESILKAIKEEIIL